MKIPNDVKPGAELIRAAYAAGKRTVVIDGIKLKIERRDCEVTFVSGNQTYKTTEQWLVAVPADGSLVPVYSVERVREGNLRSAKS